MQFFLFFRFTFKNGGYLRLSADIFCQAKAPKYILCQQNPIFMQKNDSKNTFLSTYRQHNSKNTLYIVFIKYTVIT